MKRGGWLAEGWVAGGFEGIFVRRKLVGVSLIHKGKTPATTSNTTALNTFSPHSALKPKPVKPDRR